VQAQAEIEKLARLLGVAPERLAYLQPLDPAAVRELREAATDRLFDADRRLFERLAAGAAIVPDGLAATLSQKAFGPLLTARITAVVDPKKSISVSRRLPHDFLADVAVELDPRRAAAVLRGLPPEHVAATSRILVEREEWVAMGRFVGHLHDDAIRAVVDGLDAQALVRIAYVLEDVAEAARVAGLIGDARVREMIDVAFAEGYEAEARALAAAAGVDL
jgi:hypothetical protein